MTQFLLQVAENVARQYNMTKSEFLDPVADDLAVRMALGETHIIAETKRALADEGVNVEVLDEVASGKEIKVNRSSTLVLVKNLPFLTTEAELISMFGVFGSIARVILPPTKTLALVNILLVHLFARFRTWKAANRDLSFTWYLLENLLSSTSCSTFVHMK